MHGWLVQPFVRILFVGLASLKKTLAQVFCIVTTYIVIRVKLLSLFVSS